MSKVRQGAPMKKTVSLLLMLAISLVFTADAFAKAKMIVKPSKNYDFKAVKKIVVEPITSEGCNFGKVDKDRMPKIEAILKKVKTNLRQNMLDGSKQAKTTIPFVAGAAKKDPSTLIMKYNISKFDNGNAVARLVPFAGKAKVEMDVKFINGATKEVVAEMLAKGDAQGGVVAGGLDSEVLWTATNIANAETYKFLKKYAGLDYDFWSGASKGLKTGAKRTVDVVKEEKGEKDVVKAKKNKYSK